MEIPKGYKLVRDYQAVPKTKEERKAELEAEKKEIIMEEEPSNEELIEIGKMGHFYYMDKMRLDDINNQLKEL